MHAPTPTLETFEEVTADILPACESVHHGTGGPLAADHDQGAAQWFQVGHCVHTTGYRCDLYVRRRLERLARDKYLHWSCSRCGDARTPGKFLPLHH